MGLYLRPVCAIARFDPLSGWTIQQDEGHDHCGINGIAAVGGKLRLFFANAQAKVGSLSMTPDDCASRYGYRASGPAAGTEVVAFDLPREINIQGFVYWSAALGHFVMDGYDPCQPCSVENITLPGGSVTVRIHHDALTSSNLIPMVGMIEGGTDRIRPSGWNDTCFDVVLPTLVPDESCKFSFTRKGPDRAIVANGMANPDANFWIHGFMWVA